MKHLLKSFLLLCALIAGSGSVWAEDVTYASWEFSSTSYPANKTNFTATGGTCTESTFYLNGTGSTWNSSKGYAFTAVTDITLTLKLKTAIPAGSKITFSADSYYNKSSNAPMTGFNLTASENGAGYVTTGLDVTSLTLSTTSATKTCVYTTQNALEVGNTIALKYTQTGKVGAGQGFFNNIVIKGPEAVAAGTTSSPSINGTETFLTSTAVTLTNAAASDGATIYYTLNGEDPTTTTSATCFEYTAPFELTNTTTVKAIAKHADDTNASSVVSKTFTKVTPMTVAEARAAIDASTGTTGAYVRGIVCEGGSILSSGAMNYWISDDGTEADKFEIYKGKGVGGASFTSTSDVKVGDVVVVYGDITKYNSTYEFSAGSQIISLIQKVETPTFSPAAGAVAAGTAVTINSGTDGATIYYTTDGSTPTTSSSVYSAPITIDVAKTIKAFAVKAGSPDSEIATAVYTIALPADAPTFSVAAGTYYSVQSVELSTTTDGATIYYTTDGSEPTTESTEYTAAITVDETMTIKAIAAKDGMANSTVTEALYTILLPSITVSNDLEFVCDDAAKTFPVTYENVSAEKPIVKYYESDGTTETTYDWFTAEIDGDNNLFITPEENEGAIRAGYIKIHAKGIGGDDCSSVKILVRQTAPDYATLPFSFDGGNGDISNTKGLTQSGIATKDYASSPKLKFDGTNDYLVLKIKETPGTLSFETKGNGFSGGTFKVQTSTNGVDYTDFATLTIADDVQSELFNNLDANVKYIKWVYTEKSNGNVALGNIKLSNTADVKLAASGYASFCSPLPLDLTPTENYAAYAVTATSGETVTFKKITGAVPAATPFLLYGNGGTTVSLPIATGETTTVTENMLVGTLAPTAITDVSGDYTNFGLSNGAFVKINGTIPANKAYLPVLTSKVPTAASRLTIVFDEGETTGISERVTVNSDIFATAPVYNLNGQRVAQPTRGLYIVNGKKIVVK